jgi:hypothetical protein
MNPALETLARIAEVEFSQIVVDTAQSPSHVIASRFSAKQSPIYQARLTVWGLLRHKERSSQ